MPATSPLAAGDTSTVPSPEFALSLSPTSTHTPCPTAVSSGPCFSGDASSPLNGGEPEPSSQLAGLRRTHACLPLGSCTRWKSISGLALVLASSQALSGELADSASAVSVPVGGVHFSDAYCSQIGSRVQSPPS